MTAEALACRLCWTNRCLAMDSSKPKNSDEQSPRSWRGQSRFLVLRSLGTVSAAGQDWRVWNQAMKQRLLTTQAPAHEQEVGNPTSYRADMLYAFTPRR